MNTAKVLALCTNTYMIINKNNNTSIIFKKINRDQLLWHIIDISNNTNSVSLFNPFKPLILIKLCYKKFFLIQFKDILISNSY